MAATVPLLRLHGRAVTTAQIAIAAGVAEGTLFRAFPDKDSLIQAAIETAFDPAPALDELARLDRALPLRELLVAAVGVLQRRVDEVWQLIAMVGVAMPPPIRAAPPPPSDATLGALTDLMMPYQDELRCDPAHAARLLRMMTFAGTHPRIAEGAPLTPGEIVGVVLDGIARRTDDPEARSDGADRADAAESAIDPDANDLAHAPAHAPTSPSC